MLTVIFITCLLAISAVSASEDMANQTATYDEPLQETGIDENPSYMQENDYQSGDSDDFLSASNNQTPISRYDDEEVGFELVTIPKNYGDREFVVKVLDYKASGFQLKSFPDSAEMPM